MGRVDQGPVLYITRYFVILKKRHLFYKRRIFMMLKGSEEIREIRLFILK